MYSLNSVAIGFFENDKWAGVELLPQIEVVLRPRVHAVNCRVERQPARVGRPLNRWVIMPRSTSGDSGTSRCPASGSANRQTRPTGRSWSMT